MLLFQGFNSNAVHNSISGGSEASNVKLLQFCLVSAQASNAVNCSISESSQVPMPWKNYIISACSQVGAFPASHVLAKAVPCQL